MKLKFFSHNLFNQYQNLLIAPVINSYWEDMQPFVGCESQEKEKIQYRAEMAETIHLAIVLNIVPIHLQIWSGRKKKSQYGKSGI